GWLAVNTCFSSQLLLQGFKVNPEGPGYYILCVVWATAAAFVGLKGIQYVAKVATYLPLIPLAVLLLALVKFGGSAAEYNPSVALDSNSMLLGFLLMVGQIVGFFATAGAAGVDFGMNSRDAKDVQWGGIFGILIATVFTAGIAVLVVAGARAQGVLQG